MKQNAYSIFETKNLAKFAQICYNYNYRRRCIKTQKRVLPLDRRCIADKAVDYKLYSLLQSFSYYNAQGQRFVYKKHKRYGNLTRRRLLELYNDRCADEAEKISLATISRKINLFKSIGMLAEGNTKDRFGNEVSAFILLEDFELFQYIPLDTLTYLADTASSTVIKLYALLLNKYLWKQGYVFTYAELAEAVGMPDYNNGNTRVIKNCLNSLVVSGLIEYSSFYVMTDAGVPSPRKRLEKVNTRYKRVIP